MTTNSSYRLGTRGSYGEPTAFIASTVTLGEVTVTLTDGKILTDPKAGKVVAFPLAANREAMAPVMDFVRGGMLCLVCSTRPELAAVVAKAEDAVACVASGNF